MFPKILQDLCILCFGFFKTDKEEMCDSSKKVVDIPRFKPAWFGRFNIEDRKVHFRMNSELL